MLTVEEALQRLLSQAVAVTGVQRVPTFEGLGRVLAEPVVSPIAVPPMDNSQMDGYAVRCADLASVPARLPVSQRIAAGQVGEPLAPGTVARIFTGAPVPPGADAVIPQEAVQADGDHVIVGERPQPRAWIRRAGMDIEQGATVLQAGRRLRAPEIGLAASVGAAHLTVKPRVRVAVLFTGDELVMPGEPLPPGRIYNSNRFVLRALLQGLGCEVHDLGIVADDREATRRRLVEAAQAADLIVTSGGVSVGEEDHVKPAVQAEGRLDLWQIAMKPGRPLAFGFVRGVPFIGLPGNPVSSLVTFLLFARPFVLRRQGAADVEPRSWPVRADFEVPEPDRRREFLRVRLNRDGGLDCFGSQNSAVLSSAAWADGLVDNPAGRTIRRGDMVRYLPLSELLG
jgi:molybdopterin molybdotransferase